jgi:hemin uptake protein HemP
MTFKIQKPRITHIPEEENRTNMAKQSITSAELFGDHQEIIILHAGKEYRLRITSNNKLIMTK